jgi:hypothetical protein
MSVSTDPDSTDGAHRRRPWVVLGVATVVAAVVAVALALFQPWKLWVDDTVNEAAPAGAVPITAATPATAPDATTTTSPATSTLPPTSTPSVSAAPTTTAAPPTIATPTTMAVPMPVGGAFIGIDHGTTGTAVLLQDATGVQFVRLEELDTTNGPDLFVYLSTNAADGPEGAFDDDYVNLGRLGE